jgi:hypothetical protein
LIIIRPANLYRELQATRTRYNTQLNEPFGMLMKDGRTIEKVFLDGKDVLLSFLYDIN